MEGQDRQGTPWLQWHDHDRDLSNVSAIWGEVLRKTRPAERPASAVSRRSAKKNRAGRTCGPRRTASNTLFPGQEKESGQPVEPVYATRRQSFNHWAQWPVQGRAEPECSASISKLSASRPNASNSVSTSAVCGRCIRRSRSTPVARRSSQIKTMKDDAAAVLKNGEQIKARYTKIFRV